MKAFPNNTIVKVMPYSGDFYIFKLFFDDDRVEVFNKERESVGLIFTATTDIVFKDKKIGKIRLPFPNEEIKTMKLELYDNDKFNTISTDSNSDDLEAYLNAEVFITRFLLDNNVISFN